MIKINPVKSKSKDENGIDIDVVSPETPIPKNHKVRFIRGAFECIPQNEEWPD